MMVIMPVPMGTPPVGGGGREKGKPPLFLKCLRNIIALSIIFCIEYKYNISLKFCKEFNLLDTTFANIVINYSKHFILFLVLIHVLIFSYAIFKQE